MSQTRTKGTRAEVLVRDFLRANGFPYADRLPLKGKYDEGDITGIPGCAIEVKNCRALEFDKWLRELDVEMSNAHAEVGGVWAKRKGTMDPAKWYVTMSGEVFLTFLQHWAEAHVALLPAFVRTQSEVGALLETDG